jgi:hypothetical protein
VINIGNPNRNRTFLPVVLDLDGNDVIDILPLGAVEAENDRGPRFDWNEDSIPETTAWVGEGDGLLAIDLAADGSTGADGDINQPKEIAFALWKTKAEIAAEGTASTEEGQGAAISDLEGLRRYFDTDHNELLDAGDARWSEFRVWQDANQDGVSDPGEVRTMEDAGIKLLSLLPSPKNAKLFPDGSFISGTSHADMKDGSRMLVGDVGLAYRPSDLASSAA